MNEEEFHKFRQDVLQVEGHLVGIAKSITKQVMQIPQDETLFVGEVVVAHGEGIMEFAEDHGVTIPEDRADDYLVQVYGAADVEFSRAQIRTYDANAASRSNVVPLVSGHFELLSSPYVLNPGVAVPEGMEIPARWARMHSTLSIEGLSADLDRIADESFTEMAAAIAKGANPAEVIEIHRQKIYGLIGEKCLNIDQWRVDHYIGNLYQCGVFRPSKVDEISAKDRKDGKIPYRERLHTVGAVANLLADEFQVIEIKEAA